MPADEFSVDVRSKGERERDGIYRKQEALQEPGAISKFLNEIKELGRKVVDASDEEFEIVKMRAREIMDINVGVVENPDVYLQSEVNNEISRLTDEIFQREHPKVYALAKEAVLKDLPKGIDIYNGREIRTRLILASLDHLANFLREGLVLKRWQVVAGIKPIRSSVFDALKKLKPGVNEFDEFEDKLEIFEEDLETNVEKQEALKRLISERHDRIRCRVYTTSKFNLNYLMGDIRYRPADLINKVIGRRPEWNYYMSKWLYKDNGEIYINEIEDRGGPPSSFGFFQNVARDLGSDDLVYAAWHTRLSFRRILGPKLPVEIQVLPTESVAMNSILQVVSKRDRPDINIVSPELRKKANKNVKKFLESE